MESGASGKKRPQDEDEKYKRNFMIKSDFKISDKAAQDKIKTNFILLGITIAAAIAFQNNIFSSPPPIQSADSSLSAGCVLKIEPAKGISINNLSGGGSFPPDKFVLDESDFTNRIDAMLNKIWLIESAGRLNPPAGDNGLAVGPLQLHPEALLDVNKYYGTKFIDSDRRDLEKSKQITLLYITMWFEQNAEEIAVRIFNGGPRGWRSESTDEYWNKYLATKTQRHEE